MLKINCLYISKKWLSLLPKKRNFTTFKTENLKPSDRYRAWYVIGTNIEHRVNGPCLLFKDGSYVWRRYNYNFRDDGPCVYFNFKNRPELKLWSYSTNHSSMSSQKKWFKKMMEIYLS